MSNVLNQFYKVITNFLPKLGTLLLSGFSISFLYLYYSMLQIFRTHQQSMLSEPYQTQFKAAACSNTNIPSTCFWEKIQTTSPHVMNNFRNDMCGSLPWIGLAGGATVTFIYHYGDKMKNTANQCMTTLSHAFYESSALIAKPKQKIRS